jgi:hypothetical protein
MCKTCALTRWLTNRQVRVVGACLLFDGLKKRLHACTLVRPEGNHCSKEMLFCDPDWGGGH